ncbi:MAG: radical SAM protein [Candidatus Hydrogenedentes bacterium]|nr:radical SAM protein [Candidatus Hydrogenedentota bacterium]
MKLPTKTFLEVLNVVYSRLREKPPKYLPILIAFVTYRCNLKCSFCGLCELRENTDKNELSTDEWENIYISAKRLGTLITSISGGEPILRKDLETIIESASKREISVHLCTNGTLIDKERAKNLEKAGTKIISFSLDSNIEEIHDMIRGKGQFRKTLDGIENVRTYSPSIRISINAVLCRKNYRDIHKLVQFAKKLGAVQIKFAPIHTNLLHKFKDKSEWCEFYFTEGDLKELDEEIKKIYTECKKMGMLTTSLTFYKGVIRNFAGVNKFSCYAGFLDCIITPDGRVGACCDIESNLSVKTKPLEEIWNSNEFHRYRIKVAQCNKYCWDTTNTEFSLRLNPKTMLYELPTMMKEFLFYLR